MILLDFADGVDEVVLTVDVVAVDAVEAVIVVDLEIGMAIEAVVEAAVWIVADVVALIAVAVADPIVVATVDVVDSIMIVADSAIVVVDLVEADMDHVMMDTDSRPDMGATKMIEQTNNLMILIISMMILNHVVMETRHHMTRDRLENLMAMMDINLEVTAKIRNGYDFYFKGRVPNLIFASIFMVITEPGRIRTGSGIWTGWLWTRRIWKWLWSATTATSTGMGRVGNSTD